MEGNEPYMILSKNTYGNNKAIIDKLLYTSMHRNGAPILANGGVISTTPLASLTKIQSSGGASAAGADMYNLVAEIAAIRQDSQAFNGKLQAYIVFSDIEAANKQISDIRKKAGQ
jgi:hypothetical protein